ncbi:hypothetical protein [Embleya sp. NPDC005575]|uniref:hypothetical protein n=1 Tax=Embleya sp. NPDC005575 TaxID=3156892 RepID=UPI0033A1C673
MTASGGRGFDEGRKPSRLEEDTVGVLLWLRHNAGRELTYEQIGKGVGLPVGNRLKCAVRQARKAAEHLDHRLERFLPSRDPLMRGARVTRFNLSGRGDEFGARDALNASRVAVSAMDDMRRACAYEAKNTHGVAPKAFQEMASAVDGCIQTVSGVEELGQEVCRLQFVNNELAERVATLEARLARAATGEDPYVTA